MSDDVEAIQAELNAHPTWNPTDDYFADDDYFVEAEHGLTVIASKGGPSEEPS